jgi:hypothetical protein
LAKLISYNLPYADSHVPPLQALKARREPGIGVAKIKTVRTRQGVSIAAYIRKGKKNYA